MIGVVGGLEEREVEVFEAAILHVGWVARIGVAGIEGAIGEPGNLRGCTGGGASGLGLVVRVVIGVFGTHGYGRMMP